MMNIERVAFKHASRRQWYPRDKEVYAGVIQEFIQRRSIALITLLAAIRNEKWRPQWVRETADKMLNTIMDVLNELVKPIGDEHPIDYIINLSDSDRNLADEVIEGTMASILQLINASVKERGT